MTFKPFAAAALLTALLSGSAVSQTPPNDAPPAEDFATVKAHHLARLKQELSCVEAATTFEQLHTCRPMPPMGHRGLPPHE